MSKTTPRRPRRQNKSDRLITPGASALEIRCDMMMAPFDRVMAEMEMKWGIDRLPEYVSIETADKWGSAMAKLNAAIASNNPEEVSARAAVCIRGLEAMDREATANGNEPKHPDVWEEEYNGRIFSVIKDVRDWPKAKEKLNGRRVYSMREVAVALDAIDRGLLREVMDAFPDAKVVGIKPDLPEFDGSVIHDDDLPF